MKISIITICLNSETTIEQTIKSVIEQNDDNYEYIIVDGHSTDKTLKIIEKYKNNISIIVSEPDNGIYDAMNKGIALATGDIIGIINSDDWYEKGVFAKVRKCFQKTDVEVVYGKLNVIYENGKMETLIPSDIEKLRYEMEIPHPTVFIKKEVYKKYGAFQLGYQTASDYELILRLYVAGVKFVYQDEVFANFRVGGMSNKYWKICMKETIEIAQRYLSNASLEKRTYFKDIILHKAKEYNFIELLEDYSDKLTDILNTKLGVGLNEKIAIFGSGVWGKKVYDLLLKREVRHIFLVDNDPKKWSKAGKGIEIFPPEMLKSFRGVVLVIARNFSFEILSQIREMYNPEIYCITWEEIAMEFGMKD